MKDLVRKTTMLLVMIFISLSIISAHQARADDLPVSIVCTNSVLADFTSNIITENVSIDYIMPAGACPAHFDTTPSDILKIVTADIVISLDIEPWLVNLLNKSGNTAYEEIKCSNLGEWNVPSHARAYVRTIRDGLSDILPARNTTIMQHAATYLDQINQTENELKELVKTLGFQDRKIISMKWQKDFLLNLGLNVIYSYAPPESLSVQDELDVFDAASDEHVAAIIDNLQSGTDFGARVASETGISHVIFTNFPGAIPGADTYLDMISYNTDQVIKGIQTHDQLSEEAIALKDQVASLILQRNVFVIISIIALLLCLIFLIMYLKKERRNHV